MSLSLATLATGDTNYISKHNSNYSAIEAAVNGILSALGSSATVNIGNLLSVLFGSATAFLGNTSYTTSTAGTVLTVSGGYAWRPDLGTVLAKVGSTGIDFSGQSAGTYYIVLGADGTPARSSSPTFALWSVVWTGSAFGAITSVAPVFPGGDLTGTYQSMTIAAGAVSLAKMAALAADSVIGNNTGSAATPIAVPIGGANGVASLDGSGKVPTAQLPAAVAGALSYQGTWNASTNTPALASGTGTKGYYYKVSVAGTTTLDGISDWAVGDSVVFDGTTWDKINGADPEVLSVAGLTGAITAAALNSALATNQSANTVYAGPTSGGAAAPAFRALVGADVPAIRYDIATFYPGVPGSSQLVMRWQAPRAVTVPSGATNSQASAGTAATGSTTFTIKKNGTSVGTIAWSASGTAGTFTVSSTVSLAAGDVLTITGPATADATLADIAITLAATA